MCITSTLLQKLLVLYYNPLEVWRVVSEKKLNAGRFINQLLRLCGRPIGFEYQQKQKINFRGCTPPMQTLKGGNQSCVDG
jgi:hypothetical protein